MFGVHAGLVVDPRYFFFGANAKGPRRSSVTGVNHKYLLYSREHGVVDKNVCFKAPFFSMPVSHTGRYVSIRVVQRTAVKSNTERAHGNSGKNTRPPPR